VAEAGRHRRARALSVLLTATGVLVAVAGVLLVLAGSRSPGDVAAPAASRTTVVVPHHPAPVAATSTAAAPRIGVRPEVVVVPALGVRALVSPIDTEDGALTPPADPQRLGWWTGGARPGADTGAAVLTGHTVHTGGGALDDLEFLVRGDRVLVQSGARQVAYDVSSVRVMSRDELVRESTDVFARSGPGRLVLVTCEDWDGTSYRSNVVVIARPADG
jgi:LPXTG-site transpeptidase (sortase) family protein